MRLIDANALRLMKVAECAEHTIEFAAGWKACVEYCKNDAPAIEAEPVVRCKDCKYRQDDDFCGGRGWPAQLVPDDGYCDRGARMDGDSE